MASPETQGAEMPPNEGGDKLPVSRPSSSFAPPEVPSEPPGGIPQSKEVVVTENEGQIAVEAPTVAVANQPESNESGNSFLGNLPSLNLPTVPRLERGKGISFSLVALLALASLITVSNLYITQPLLLEIADYFNTTKGAASSLVALSQAGYCVGLILITPLGDVMPRRFLVISLTAICAFLTAMEAISPSIPVFQLLQFFVGMFTVVPQIVIPTVADVSPPGRVSKNVGFVVGFTLIGTLYGRVVAGAIAAALGWRAVFFIACGTQVAVLLFLVLFFPHIPLAQSNVSYLAMLVSVWTCIKTTDVLRQSMIIAFCCYVAMTNFWTTTVFLMGSPIYNLPVSTIGLLGVAGIGGILAAPLAGYLPFKPHTTIAIGVSLQFLSLLIGITAGTLNVAVLFVCAFLMDFGRQLQQLNNQIRIYAALPGHKSRANAAYMTFAYLGTFVGVSLGTVAYEHAGWSGACAVGMGALGCAAIAWLWIGADGTLWYDRIRGKRKSDKAADEDVKLEEGKAVKGNKEGDAQSAETVAVEEPDQGEVTVVEPAGDQGQATEQGK